MDNGGTQSWRAEPVFANMYHHVVPSVSLDSVLPDSNLAEEVAVSDLAAVAEIEFRAETCDADGGEEVPPLKTPVGHADGAVNHAGKRHNRQRQPQIAFDFVAYHFFAM